MKNLSTTKYQPEEPLHHKREQNTSQKIFGNNPKPQALIAATTDDHLIGA